MVNSLRAPFDLFLNLGNLEELSDDIEVHAGMLEASLYIFKKIREKHLLDNAKMYFPDFSVVGMCTNVDLNVSCIFSV